MKKTCRNTSEVSLRKHGVMLQWMVAVVGFMSIIGSLWADSGVHMLVPGFTSVDLPLKLTNLDNIRYRHDGALVALGYDGRIHLLRDTDGDGLEDKAEVFWDQPTMRGPIGMALTLAGDPRGEGVFVASKGKVSLIVDRNRDGRADEEIIVATGWKEIPQNVDAVGMAVDPRDGSLYFCLGCANYADAYQIDKATGKAAYDLQSERGTIQRVSADFKTRETICTGIRFANALAFNQYGDLFATEQEGATWLPNGNARDELLHIQKGRHYGFPPRHPVHLPNVSDEPAVMEYGPQHQCTVGMVFNESVNGGAIFGPAHWQHDALICGESRGKLYRTKLHRTPQGYVAENHIIACLGLLLVDCCVSPHGDLLLACHSGPPDWGTGPAGEGRLIRLRYTQKNVPQPMRTWASAPDEFCVTFDRDLDAKDWKDAAVKIRIEAGLYVNAGDRFETIRPGYQVVKDQQAVPRREVPVEGVRLTGDLRTLILKIAPQTEAVNYAVTLPAPAGWGQASLDLLITLHGVQAVDSTGRQPSMIVPHVDRALVDFPDGFTEVKGIVSTSDPYTPLIQQGAVLDWTPERVDFTLTSTQVDIPEWPSHATFKMAPLSPVALVSRGKSAAIPFSRLYVPWATPPGALPKQPLERTDVKGRWLRGRRVFFGAEAACAACHIIRGEGVLFGPDLTNLVSRDRESVWRDIFHPSATLNPDQTASTLTLLDGTQISGIIRSQSGEKYVVALPAGATTEVAATKVQAVAAMKTSLMPEGLLQRLTNDQQEDLMTFLLTDPLVPAIILPGGQSMPAPRSRTELPPLIASGDGTPLRILLSAGPKDHGDNEHDYPLWQQRWTKLLALADNVTVESAWEFPTAEQLASTDVAVFFSKNPGWNPRAAMLLDTYQQRGGGLVYLHWAIEGGDHAALLVDRIGLASRQTETKYRHGEFDLVFTRPEHPITNGLSKLHFTDETYWALQGDPARTSILGTGLEDGAARPQLWTYERNQARVVGCVPGHYTWTFDDPLYRLLVFRSICWAAHDVNVDRLVELITVGARIGP